jgi:hypothetical protein
MTALRRRKAVLFQGSYQDYPLCHVITNCCPYISADRGGQHHYRDSSVELMLLIYENLTAVSIKNMIN